MNTNVEITPHESNVLRTYNIVMGFFHLIQSTILFFIVDYSIKIPIVTDFFDIVDPATNEVGLVEQVFWDVPVAAGAAVFLLLSAIAHFIIASPLYFDTYIKNLKRGMNQARWFEYAISSSVMLVIIGLLGGIIQLSAVVFLFALNALMNLLGLAMERHNLSTEKTDWTSYILGCFAGIVPWIMIALYFYNGITNFNEVNEQAIPDYAIASFFVLFLFYNTFAINMYLQYRKMGWWKDYLFGEKVYIFLSLSAKSALAWIIYFGTTNSELS